MNTNAKLVICSVLSLVVGIGSIVPLTFLMAAKGTSDVDISDETEKPWYTVTMKYAYLEAGEFPYTYRPNPYGPTLPPPPDTLKNVYVN